MEQMKGKNYELEKYALPSQSCHDHFLSCHRGLADLPSEARAVSDGSHLPCYRGVHGLRGCGLLEGEAEVGMGSDCRCSHFPRLLCLGADAAVISVA